jgi:orotate phosphoribosyltransferase
MPKMDKPELAAKISAVSLLRGQFQLRSGAFANEYFGKYRFESDPVILADIADAMASMIPPGVDALAGLELGGVPLATALSLRTRLPVRFVRKHAKGYGTCQLAEGGEIAGRRLVIVEDVVTSGGQVLTSCEELRKLGAIVEDVVCVIGRQAGGASALTAAGLTLRALFVKSDLDGDRHPVHPRVAADSRHS